MNKKLLILISFLLVLTTSCKSNKEENVFTDNFNACYDSLVDEKPIEACNELSDHLKSYITKTKEDQTTLDESILLDTLNKLQAVIDISQDFNIRNLTQGIYDDIKQQVSAFDSDLNLDTYRSVNNNDSDQAYEVLNSFISNSNFKYLETINLSTDLHDLEKQKTAYLFENNDGIHLSIVMDDNTPTEFIFDQHNQTLNKLVFAKEVTHTSKFIYQHIFNNNFFEAEKMAQNVYMLILKEEDTSINFDNTSNYVSKDRIIISALNHNEK